MLVFASIFNALLLLVMENPSLPIFKAFLFIVKVICPVFFCFSILIDLPNKEERF